MLMKLRIALCAILALFWTSPLIAASPLCRSIPHETSEYIVCEVDLRQQEIRLFWTRPDGRPYGYLSSLPRSLDKHSGALRFATNGGMYHPDGSPVGLYIEHRRELIRANTKPGPGNFHMRPNGVLYVSGDRAGVMETRTFLLRKPQAEFATQSGPMLVVDGRLHPHFARNGGSRKYRVGVGSRDPNTLVFAVSQTAVSFGEFGRLFRDPLRSRNALFLDGGSAASLYAPELRGDSNLVPLGPMIGVYDRGK